MNGRPARWLLIVLLVGELVLLTRQVDQTGRRGGLLEQATVVALGPVAQGVAALQGLVVGLGERFATRRRLWEENHALRDRVARLERQNLRRLTLESDFRRLAFALRYAREAERQVRPVDVVYADHASWLRSLILYVGPEGALPNQPVVGDRGLVGRVVIAAGSYAKAQLVTDRSSAVGAMVERTRRQGVVRGAGTGRLTLNYLPRAADVRVGDRVVTAGIDGTYPRGLPVGIVTAVEPGVELFHRIDLAPEVDFGLLDMVYLLPVESPPATVREDPGARP